jgi:steroid delta-isomerase-like uncharacterized protein
VTRSELTDFAIRFAAAWSGQEPEALAPLFAEDAVFTVNGGPPAIGRAAIVAMAREYMTAFPDMVVELDSVSREGDAATFHWHWTGTNTGPGGTGRSIRMSGYEEWTFGPDGLLVQAKGYFDEAEYRRQLGL